LKVLVTGASGFIGSHLVARLQTLANHSVLTLERNPKFPSTEKVSRCQYDHSKDRHGEHLIKAVKDFQPDAVVHLAAQYLQSHETSQVEQLIFNNVTFGALLLDALSKLNRPVAFVSAGTCWQQHSQNELGPSNLYAATRSSFWELVRFYSSAFPIQAAEVRLLDTYGEGDTRRKVVQALLERCQAQDTSPLKMSQGNQLLSLTHVDDVVSGLILTLTWLQSQPRGAVERFALVNPQLISLRDLAAMIQQIADFQLNIEWGALSYRPREVMDPSVRAIPLVPGWTASQRPAEGITRYWHSIKRPYRG